MRHETIGALLFFWAACPAQAGAQQLYTEEVEAAVFEMYDSAHFYDYAALRDSVTDNFEMMIFGRRMNSDEFEQLLRGMEERGVQFSETQLLDFNTEIVGEDVAYTTWRTTNWVEGAILRRDGNRWLIDRAWSVRIPSSE